MRCKNININKSRNKTKMLFELFKWIFKCNIYIYIYKVIVYNIKYIIYIKILKYYIHLNIYFKKRKERYNCKMLEYIIK